jgi:hypothetical protein
MRKIATLLLVALAFAGHAQLEPKRGINIFPYVASGTNTYTVTFTGITNIKSGDEFRITFTNGNTAASTINGTALVKNPTTALASGDLAAGGTYVVRYTGTNFQVLNIAGSGGGGLSGLTSGRVSFATSSTTIGGSANLFWDDTNKILDLRSASRARFQRADNALYWDIGLTDSGSPNDFIINGNFSTGFQFQQSGAVKFQFNNTGDFNINGNVNFSLNGSSFLGTGTITANTKLDVRGLSGGTNIARFATNSNTERFAFKDAGGFAVGGSEGTSGQVLKSGGAGSPVTWGGVSLTTDVTGILPVANGGTNRGILGSANQVLRVNPAGLDTEWATPILSASYTQLASGTATAVMGAREFIENVSTTTSPNLEYSTGDAVAGRLREVVNNGTQNLNLTTTAGVTFVGSTTIAPGQSVFLYDRTSTNVIIFGNRSLFPLSGGNRTGLGSANQVLRINAGATDTEWANSGGSFGYTTTVTAAGTTVLTASSNYLQFFTGTTTQTITLPSNGVSSSGGTATQFYIRNNSTGVLTVNASGGGTVRTMAGNTMLLVTCLTTNGTLPADWNALYQGYNFANGKIMTVNNSLTLTGTDATTMTFPSTSASIARIDAGQTFTGVNNFTSPAITTSITTPSTSFDLINTNATTVNLAGASTTFTLGATTGTLTLRNVTLSAPNATSFAMNGASPSITSTSTGTASLFNTNILTGNLYGAATTVAIGAATGTATINNVTTAIKHLDGTTAAPGIAAGVGAGTTPTVTMGTNSNDISGIINITTGTTPTGTNAIVATITFNTAYVTAPFVTLTPANRNAQALTGANAVLVPAAGQTNGVTTAAFIIESGPTALNASTPYIFYYHVIQ